VSRYKAAKWPISCLGCRWFVNVHWRSVAVGVVSEPEICHGAGFNCVQMRVSGFSSHYEFVLVLGSAFAKTLSDWRSQAGVTTAPAIALAKAGQLTFIDRVRCCYCFK
jgi:hypothetical protein